MPFRCRDCKKYISFKTGTAMESSNLSLRKWVWAIYLENTSLKGVSSMKFHILVDVVHRRVIEGVQIPNEAELGVQWR